VISFNEKFDDDVSALTPLSEFDIGTESKLNANFTENEKECRLLVENIQSKIKSIIDSKLNVDGAADNKMLPSNLNNVNNILQQLGGSNNKQSMNKDMLLKLMSAAEMASNSNNKSNQKPTIPEPVSDDEDDVTYNSKMVKDPSPVVSDDEDEEFYSNSKEKTVLYVSDDQDEGEDEDEEDIEEETYYNEQIPAAAPTKINKSIKDPTLLVVPKIKKTVRFNLPDLPPVLDHDEFQGLSLFEEDVNESKIQETEQECDDLFAKIRAKFNQSN